MSSPPSPLTVTEGEAPFHVPAAGKPCKTYYKIAGDLASATEPPLIVAHGGPGVEHGYLIPLADLAHTPKGTRAVVFYDQLGCGASTHLPEKNGDTAFWSDELFMDELDNLRAHLRIGTYDALGHSWGGMLLARVAATRPQGLRRLVLASAPADMHMWAEAINVLKRKLPQDMQDVLDKHERDSLELSPEYHDGVREFFVRHACLLDPWPKELTSVMERMGHDPTVNHTMYGRYSFDIRGRLKDWTVIPELPKISVPTLLVNGRYDEAQDSVMRPFFDKIPRVKWYTFAESSHMPHFEEREKYMQVVGDFLSD